MRRVVLKAFSLGNIIHPLAWRPAVEFLPAVEKKRVRVHAGLEWFRLWHKRGDRTWNANSGCYCTRWRGIAIRRRGRRTPAFFDYEIAGVYFWANLHDRSTSWACDPQNWPAGLRSFALPSQPTMSRRLKSASFLQLLKALERVWTDHASELALTVDAKPLLVGSHSKDPDAAWARVRRGWAQGYKLHVIFGAAEHPRRWDVEPLNKSEPKVAARLVESLEPGGGYLLGDAAYDSNPLHRATTAGGRQLLAPRKRPHSGLGHCRHSPSRLRSIELLEGPGAFGRALHAERDDVERRFGRLTNHAAGLAPLPNWVRRIHRVRLWVQTKLLIHAAYVLRKEHPPPIAVA